MINRMQRILILLLGHLTLALGVLGIFLPVLPTTPFLLVTAGCYLKSSPKLYNWLVNHKLFGPYILSYIKYKSLTVKTKVISIVSMWALIIFSIIFVINIWHVKLALIVISISVSIFILKHRTLTDLELEELK